MADSDSITRAIDGAYNAADNFVRGVGAVLGVDVDKPGPDEEPGISTRTMPAQPAMAVPQSHPALPAPRVLALPAPAFAPAWFVIPLRDVSGATKYAVTDGKTGALADTPEAAAALLALLNGKAAA